MKLFVFCLAVALASAIRESRKHPCDDTDCQAGRECVVVEGEPKCLCVISCPDHFKPVCGTDGRSYDNHCQLHQHACLSGEHIGIEHKGFCKKDKHWKKETKKQNNNKQELEDELQNDLVEALRESESKNKKKKAPAVCFGPQRNALRFLLVEHWKGDLSNQAWYSKGMTYRESLWGWFFSCDTNKDNFVTPEEILKCASDVSFFARPGQDNQLTKELCIDALVDDGDKNNDWRLSFEEFTRVMDPKYQPKEKKCSLEGRSYLDGEEIHLHCNHCVCAVGHWVCSSVDCGDDLKAEHEHRLKELRQNDDFYNEIDEHVVDPLHASADTWEKTALKTKSKGKELLTKENFDVDDNLQYETGVVTRVKKEEEEKEVDLPATLLDELYDDVYEKTKSKKKQQLHKALKEVRMLKKKTNELKNLYDKKGNKDDLRNFKKKQVNKKMTEPRKEQIDDRYKNYKEQNFRDERHDRETNQNGDHHAAAVQSLDDDDFNNADEKHNINEKQLQHYNWNKYADDLFEKTPWNDLIVHGDRPVNDKQNSKRSTRNNRF